MNYNMNYSLYLVTDRYILNGRDLNKSVEEAIIGGVTMVQIREKEITSRDFYEISLSLKEICDYYNIPLIVNDRIDIALAIDAAGVHLGQTDIPCKSARKLIGSNKILGISAATMGEALKAETEGADYIGVGAVFPTETKLDARQVSIDALADIKKSISIPVVAIGGINESNYTQLRNTGIDGIAVVSAILGKNNIKEAASILRL